MDEADVASYHEITELSLKLRAIQASLQNNVSNPDSEESIRLCIECGNVIPEARLKAMPGALRCIHCQELYEAKE